jgi:tripartite-type tricarboxylate transporter receptor subunit TctC
MMRRSSLSLCVVSLLLGWAQAGNAQSPDKIDRPVTIYVAGTAGGGIDLYARLVSRYASASMRPRSR